MTLAAAIKAVSDTRKSAARLDLNRHLFCAGNFGKCVPWLTTDMLLAWRLHAEVGLAGEAVGQVLFLFLSVGALATLGAGYLMTALGLSPHKLLWLQLGGAIVTGVSFVLQFTALDLGVVLAAGLAFRVGYALQDIPQKALSSILPRDDEDTRRYVRLQTMLSPIAKLAITLAYLWAGGRLVGLALPVLSLVAIGVVVSAALMLGVRPTAPMPAAEPTVLERRRAPAGWGAVFLVICVAAIILPVTRRLLIFAPDADGWRNLGAWFLCAFCAGSILGPGVLKRLERAFGAARALIAIAGVAAVTAWAQAMGEAQTAPRLVAALVHGVAIGALLTSMWTAVALLARDDAARTGRRRDAAIFGIAIAATHAAGAVGALIVGPLIEGAGRHDLASMTGAALATSIAAVAMAWLLLRRERAGQLA